MLIDVFLVVLICFVAFTPIIIEYRLGIFDLFNIKNAFIVYYVIQLGFSGLISISDKYPSEIGISPIFFHQYYTEAFFLSLVGIITFQMGYYFSYGKSLKIPSVLKFSFKTYNSYIIVIIYFLLGGLSFFIFLQVNGGITEFLNNRGMFRAEGIAGQGFLLFPCTHLLTVAVMVYMINRLKNNPSSKYIYISLILLIISIIPAYFMGFRGLMVLPILEFLVIFNYCYKKIPFLKMIPIATVLVSGFVIYGIVRELPANIKITPEIAFNLVEKNPELAYAFLSRSKGTEVVAAEIKKLDETGEYDYGYKSLIETLTIFVPGSLWKDKPTPSSVRFTTYFFGEDLAFSRGYQMDAWGGISPTIVGETYWHFGWLGVILGLYAFGWLVGKIYLTFIRNKDNIFVLLIYAEIYPLFIMMAEAVQGYANSFLLYSITLTGTFFILKIKLTN